MKNSVRAFCVALCLAFVPGSFFVYAEEQQFLSADRFIERAFNGEKPIWKMLAMNAEIQMQAHQILGHDYNGMRIHYWQLNQKTVWVIDEIGKEKPITVGVVVNQGIVEDVKILVYRELRGNEVARSSFLTQFISLLLTSVNKLNKSVDTITGATLSVNAVTNAVRLALLFNRYSVSAN